MTNHAYEPGENRVVDSFRRIHANSEQTHVIVVETGEDYAAIAYDIDPREYEPVASEIIAYDPTKAGAKQRASRWCQENPKGIGRQSGGPGLLRRVLSKLNSYGQTLADQQQQQQQSQSQEKPEQ